MNENEKEDKVFIPLSIEKVDFKESYFFDAKKASILIASAILACIVWLWLATKTGSILGMIISLLLLIYPFLWVVRRWIFEEPKWKKIRMNLEHQKNSNHMTFWGVDSVSETGIIRYALSYNSEFKQTIIVKILNGSIVNKTADFYKIYQKTHEVFTARLLKSGYHVERMSMLVDREPPAFLKNSLKNAMKIENSIERSVTLEHIHNLINQTKVAMNINGDFYIVQCRSIADIRDFRKNVTFVVNDVFKDNFYKLKKLLNRKEIFRFFELTSNITSMSSDYKPTREDFTTTMESYGKVISVNVNGEEIDYQTYKNPPVLPDKEKVPSVHKQVEEDGELDLLAELDVTNSKEIEGELDEVDKEIERIFTPNLEDEIDLGTTLIETPKEHVFLIGGRSKKE